MRRRTALIIGVFSVAAIVAPVTVFRPHAEPFVYVTASIPTLTPTHVVGLNADNGTVVTTTATTTPPPVVTTTQRQAPPSPVPTRKTTVRRLPTSATAASVSSWESKMWAAVTHVGGSFVIRDRGAWGATDMSSCVAFIAPRTPLAYIDDVVYHEGGHIRQCRRGMAPDEHVADCFAKLMGATWLNYGCTAAAMAVAKTL